MERTVEPELMDEAAQALAYAQADFSTPHNHFVELTRGTLPASQPLYALDLGCGPADVTVRLALAYPQLRVDGVDGAANMLRLGEQRVAQAGLSARVHLFQLLLPAQALPRPSYDAVVSNSLLHHLHDPAVFWRTLRQAAGPRAHVCVMDLRRPPSVEHVGALVAQHAAQEPAVLREDFRASLHAAFTVDEVRAHLQQHHLDGLEVDAVGDRHLFIHGTLRA